ncbi:hypothetical protein BDP27DRAFT_1309824 [Rhodocollybia butyracea]|uniref:EF-hand domain-containing protein n=1 Tax=Rhodocollybia butyracea TaxID=206335 RepID=A0A9P5QBV4_9AGAR|nr:hypothetical protein BDP27DRAFT_1309824 [Rhodocollybia butyracea]
MSFLTNTVGNIGSAAKNVVSPQQSSNDTQDIESPKQPLKSEPETKEESEQPEPPPGGFMSSLGKAGSTITNTASSGLTSGVSFTSDLAKNGAQLASDAANAGASISQTVAKSGLDMTASVVGRTVDISGTAIGGIVNTAAETSGKVFEPVGSGLKAIEGFDKLGVADGLKTINGLPVLAAQNVGKWTMMALNMSGKTPTFFDVDGDGKVSISDTIKGLIVLGLDEKNSRYAAYALHAIFSFPTGTAWIPTDTNLPITVSNMSRTRWGRNWGLYDRIEWVQDVDINEFFAPSSDDATWQEKFKKGRQYFGVLLLIFEWGTTWPFLMPDVPVEQIPFKDEIGKVVRTLILPTILSNFQRARAGKFDAGNHPPAKETPSGPTDA